MAEPAAHPLGDRVDHQGGERVRVSVAYVGAAEQFLRPLEVRPGSTLRAAIEQSGVLDKCPEIDLEIYKVGVFGRVTDLDQILADGDRAEIYRPLIADPKQARKRRAEEGKRLRQVGE
ncbi:RnfH family protein [uncultured Lamprocystis sp.]|jgi:putative ubiquitin-RnfH superfamily antitoxin RatB of RatAB toxin-antitoxin module|uniref:RnfH family protein n=1 Tax=uncultured Lamprocystis sp. TaxID=543132 RepID=UPI0025F4BD2C|nr:RnfH family protein [uncultured Lamprocystis sp.]